MSQVIGSSLGANTGADSVPSLTLAQLQAFKAGDNPEQVIKVSDIAEAPHSFTWAYSDGSVWRSVYLRSVVSTDPGSLASLKVATVWNPMFMALDTVSQELYGYATLSAHLMGSEPATHLVPNFINAFLDRDSTSTLTNTGNTLPIQKLAVHIEGAPKAALVYWNGSRAYTIADGAADVNADEIPASAFGLDEIPGGSIISAKLIAVFSGPAAVPYSNRNPAEGHGTAMYRFDPAQTTMSDTDVPGSFTWTGADPVMRSGGYYPFFLARHKNKQATALIAIGTSITAAVSDPADVFGGSAWFQRSLKNFTVVPGAFNFAISGSTSLAGKDDQRLSAYFKYCTAALIEEPTNDLLNPSALTAAQAKARVDFRRDQMVAGGIPANKIVLVLPIAQTTSTDGWATEANQVPKAGWGAGEVVQQYKALAQADTRYGLVLSREALLGANGLCFKANLTPDGLHPNRDGHILEAAHDAPLMEAFFSAA
jgi:lysophospholipase L1-like esterase